MGGGPFYLSGRYPLKKRDFSALGAELKKVREAEILHIDIMDGNFVPNLTMGPQVVKALRGKTDQEFDLHLMLRHPLQYVPVFREAGADWITFHIECDDDPRTVLASIEASGAKPGIAIKPGTPGTLKAHFPNLLIEVDGGINLENAHIVREAGTDVLIAGTAVFTAKDPEQAIQLLRGEPV